MDLRNLKVKPLGADFLLKLVTLIEQIGFQAPEKKKSSYHASPRILQDILAIRS